MAAGCISLGGLVRLGSGFFGADAPADSVSPAVQAVLRQEGKKDMAGLATAVRDADENAARRAMVALRQVAPPRQAAEAIRPALADSRPRVRQQAAAQLALIGPPAAATLPALKDAVLKDKTPEVRASAAQALAKLKTTGAIDPLTLALNDADPLVRRSANEGLNAMLGLRLAFDPDGPIGRRQTDFARIRSTVPGLKRAFDLWEKRGAEPAKEALKTSPKSASNQTSHQEVAKQ
jgi:hypothetical protein